MTKAVLMVAAGIVLLGGYFFANYQGEEVVPTQVSDTAMVSQPVEIVVALPETELLEEAAPNENLLTTMLRNVGGQQSSLSMVNSEYILVNFWATWCKPCVEEMPMLEALQQELGSRQFSIVGLAIDAADPAKKMVEKLEITYPIFIADLEGPELMANNGNEQGLLPYTLLMDASGEVLASKLGTVKEQDIRGWLSLVLSSNGT